MRRSIVLLVAFLLTLLAGGLVTSASAVEHSTTASEISSGGERGFTPTPETLPGPLPATTYNHVSTQPFTTIHNRQVIFEVQGEKLTDPKGSPVMRGDGAITCLNGSTPRVAFRCTNIVDINLTLIDVTNGIPWGSHGGCGITPFGACGLPKHAVFTGFVCAVPSRTWKVKLTVGSVNVGGDVYSPQDEIDITTAPFSPTITGRCAA